MFAVLGEHITGTKQTPPKKKKTKRNGQEKINQKKSDEVFKNVVLPIYLKEGKLISRLNHEYAMKSTEQTKKRQQWR